MRIRMQWYQEGENSKDSNNSLGRTLGSCNTMPVLLAWYILILSRSLWPSEGWQTSTDPEAVMDNEGVPYQNIICVPEIPHVMNRKKKKHSGLAQ